MGALVTDDFGIFLMRASHFWQLPGGPRAERRIQPPCLRRGHVQRDLWASRLHQSFLRSSWKLKTSEDAGCRALAEAAACTASLPVFVSCALKSVFVCPPRFGRSAHVAVGRTTRRMQVADRNLQHQDMLEAAACQNGGGWCTCARMTLRNQVWQVASNHFL